MKTRSYAAPAVKGLSIHFSCKLIHRWHVKGNKAAEEPPHMGYLLLIYVVICQFYMSKPISHKMYHKYWLRQFRGPVIIMTYYFSIRTKYIRLPLLHSIMLVHVQGKQDMFSYSVGLMLGRRRRRWLTINQHWVKISCFISAWYLHIIDFKHCLLFVV